MRILVVGNAASPHVRRWVRALHEAGHEVCCSGFGELADDELPMRSLGSSSLSHRRYVLGIPALRRTLHAFRPDVVHAHFVASYGLMTMAVVRSVPVVQFAWGSDVLSLERQSWWQRQMVIRALRKAAAVVFDAELVGARVRAYAPDARAELVTFGPELAWTSAPRSERPSVLSPRGMKPLYNVAVIVEAFAMFSESHPEWRLDVLTAGDDPEEYRRIAERHPDVAPRITFWPELSRDDLQRRFLEAAIFCSVPSTDATSAALLEGMASGAFPIVSNLPANRAWIENGRNGLIVDSGDVPDLAAALAVAADDESLRIAAAHSNRARVASDATWEHSVGVVEDLSAQVVDARDRKRKRSGA
jgi:glycosyltransferase involved in cell wall biosynthesis